jgi:iron complex outermembrane receptor protein
MKCKLVVGAVAASVASIVSGQEQQQQGAGLEEIVVTATRREQNLQDVPISIVAITGDNLEQRGLDTLEEVSQAIPNVVVTGTGGGTAGTGFSVRGIPNVGTYVDGVWQIDSAGILVREFVDLDRIEVLRGPQGTTFGRDSTGGAIRLWTRRPGEEFGADVSVAAGSYERRDVKIAVDVPLTDKLLTKWTGASLFREGYITSQTTGQKDGGLDQTVFRGDMVWMPTDNLNLRFNYQNYSNVFSEPKVIDALFRTMPDPGIRTQLGIAEMYGLAGAEPFNAMNNWSGYPGGKVSQWENRSNVRLPNEMDVEQYTLDINLNLSDSLSLQFLTGYTDQENKLSNDWDSSQYDIVYDINQQDNDLFSQEIQLSGSRGRFEWVGGIYYWEESSHRRETRNVASEFLNGDLDVNTVLASAHCQAPAPTGFTSCAQVIYGGTGAPNAALQGLRNQGYDRIPHTERDGYAAFGEATVGLTEKMDFTFGVRYHEENIFSEQLNAIPGVTAVRPLVSNQWHIGGDPFAGSVATTGPGVPWEHSYDKVTSRLSLQNQFSDNVMGYISYAEGFNSGGVATPTIDGVRQLLPYDPQTIKTFEIGLRSDLADGKVRFNATLFDTDWVDFQSAGVVYDSQGRQVPQLQTTNVGDAAAKGMEFELTYLPTQAFMVQLGLGLLDTEYTELPPGQMSGHLPWTTDTEFPRAPDTSYNLGLQYTASLDNGGSIVIRGDYLYQGQFWRFEPFLRMDAYPSIPSGYDESGDQGIVNARMTFEPPTGQYAFSLFGTNLTDEYMINSGFFHGIWGWDFATVARPREVGAQFEFRF